MGEFCDKEFKFIRLKFGGKSREVFMVGVKLGGDIKSKFFVLCRGREGYNCLMVNVYKLSGMVLYLEIGWFGVEIGGFVD
jgi:hypothetical protein